jgi:hypothetical protein
MTYSMNIEQINLEFHDKFEKVGGVTLLKCSDALLYMNQLQKYKILVITFNGFWYPSEYGGIQPDMSLSTDIRYFK